MELQNIRSSGKVQRHKWLLYAVLCSMILLPLILFLFTGTNDGRQLVSLLEGGFQNGGFRADSAMDATSILVLLQKDPLSIRWSFHSIICLFSWLVLIAIAITRKDKHLIPYTVLYSIVMVFIGAAYYGTHVLDSGGGYNRLMLWGASVLAMDGPLPLLLYAAAFCGCIFYLVMDQRSCRKKQRLQPGAS